MQASIDRNDVLEINGERYEVLNSQGAVYSLQGGREMVVELNRIGESPQEPRFLLLVEPSEEDGMQFWERDRDTGALIDKPVQSMRVLEI